MVAELNGAGAGTPPPKVPARAWTGAGGEGIDDVMVRGGGGNGPRGSEGGGGLLARGAGKPAARE